MQVREAELRRDIAQLERQLQDTDKRAQVEQLTRHLPPLDEATLDAIYQDLVSSPRSELSIPPPSPKVSLAQLAAELGLPHAPKQFIQYLTEDDRPQVKKDVDYEGGMGVSIGRLREDSIFDWKFVGLAHNTLRGAAGGALESAEMLKALGYITKK